MKDGKQPTFIGIVGALLGAYVFPFVICAVLILIEFNTEDWAITLRDLLLKLSGAEYFIHAALEAGIPMPDLSVVVYFLSGLLLLFFAAKLFYFQLYPSEKKLVFIHIAFLVLSWLTLSISVPPNNPSFTEQNFVMAGYFFVALFANQIIYMFLFSKNVIENYLSRSTCNTIALLMGIIAGLIVLICTIHGDNMQKRDGLTAVVISGILGFVMQWYYAKTTAGKAYKRNLKKHAFLYFLYENTEIQKKGTENIPEESRNNILLLVRKFEEKIVKIPLDNETVITVSIKTIAENRAGFSIKKYGNKIAVELANLSQEFRVYKNFFLFRYSLPIGVIAKKINDNKRFELNHLAAAFNRMKKTDLPRKELSEDIDREAKKYGNYVGEPLIPATLGNPNYSGKEKYIPVKIYYSFEYSLPLSELNEYCSNYLANNPMDIITEEQFLEAWQYAITKSLGKIAPQEPKISGYNMALIAINMGSLDKLKAAFESGSFDINKQGKSTEETLLHYSAIRGHYEITKYLLGKGANPNIPNLAEQRPLHFAALSDKTETVKLLLEYGAEKNVKDDWGNTPLMCALRENHPATAKILLDKGADITAADNTGKTTMEIARDANPELVKLITNSKQYAEK